MSFYRRLRFCLLLAASLFLASQPAWATKRVALVVGNSSYQNAPLLPNPANDAAAIATTLRGAGFDVVDSRLNLAATDMRRALREFADQAREADIALVYYAGHGIEIDGTNYLIPTDAKLERDTDIYDEAFSLDRVLLAIEPARQLRVVIVDACRNNPFADTMKRTVASRSISRGLARVEPTVSNTLIAFAAKAGLTALDGNSKNSPYATALVKYIAKPGLDLRRAFGFVRDDVLQATGNRQEPYVYGSLGGEDVALVPAPMAEEPTQAANPQSEIRRDYELALQLRNKAALSAFLTQHPDGYYASLAKLQLNQLDAEDARIAATEKARQAEQQQARLKSEGAQRADQEKAAANLKVAEEARIAAERTKQAAQEQAAEAERKRTASEAAIVAALSGTKPAVENNVAASSEAAAPVQDDQGAKLAALSTGPQQTDIAKADIAKSIQSELSRVGCFSGAIDGQWNAASQRSLALFNRHAGTKFDAKLASLDALDAIKLKASRVCPLICDHGYRADGDQCSRITCAEGSFLNDDNECETRRGKKPVAKRNTNERPFRADRSPRERPNPTAEVPRRQATAKSSGGSGQIVCDQYLCRQVRSGCHLEYRGGGGPGGNTGNVEVCH
ncbi:MULTISPECIES: caspase family protein [unclassified Bradyrhizobium]|uniref:caspase family protein n=1 Tax=unclassified Bradyrhizobium TaxID=2631580 RepID=UPI00247B0D76|nr:MULTISPECIES: caspase family protein [unclassified Bradyrhizobium]WGR68710.1 caspase family protein [Bradyrhizobium sp. ISRA426]WGR80765.1 caspase family protein [Bradyrhizobium sp. ISRA430]WGR83950.1 caspase family protein [Bradyrhizobium sp. ISRA432]